MHWGRFSAGLVGMLVCLPMVVLPSSATRRSLELEGYSVFLDIVASALVLSGCAGILTLTQVNRERRDGTIELLCLTGVKPLEFLLGAFGALGAMCVCALLAFLPMIMLPVLAGGVTGGEAFRTMLVLLNTLLLSLATGLWTAAGTRGWVSATQAAGSLGLLLFLIPGPSPIFAFYWASDAGYTTRAWPYWTSVLLALGTTWCLVFAGDRRLRGSMRTESGPATMERNSIQGAAAPSRVPIDYDDPVGWLVRRQVGIKAIIWSGAAASVLTSLISLTGNRLSNDWPVNVTLAALQAGAFGWVASRFFVEGRRTGELELLLTTPCGASTIVSSQWAELRRLFMAPIIVIMIPRLFSSFSSTMTDHNPANVVCTGILVCLNTVVGVGALIWTGFWLGLRTHSPIGTIVRIILIVQGCPYLLGLVWSTIAPALQLSPAGSIGFLPMVMSTFYYVWLIQLARRRVTSGLADGSPARFSLERFFSRLARDCVR